MYDTTMNKLSLLQESIKVNIAGLEHEIRHPGN